MTSPITRILQTLEANSCTVKKLMKFIRMGLNKIEHQEKEDIFVFLFRKIREIRAAFKEQAFRFRITLEGILFVIVTLAIGIAAMNTGAQLLFLVFSMMCAFWVLSAILADASMRQLRIKRFVPRDISMLEPTTIRFSITNTKKRWASSSIRIVDFLEGEKPLGATFAAQIDPGQTVDCYYQVVFPHRGKYQLRTIHVISHYPFGWIKRAFPRLLPVELVVLPAVLPVHQLLESSKTEHGDYSAQKKGRGTGLYSTRPYTAGESVRDVHWKLSARSNTLMMREYESDEYKRASVLLDNRLPEKPAEELLQRFELGIVLASSLVQELVRRGYQVELVTATGRVGFDQRPNHVQRCRRALATLEAAPVTAFAPAASEADSVMFQVALSENEPLLDPTARRMNVSEFRETVESALQQAPKPNTTEPLTMEKLAAPAA